MSKDKDREPQRYEDRKTGRLRPQKKERPKNRKTERGGAAGQRGWR